MNKKIMGLFFLFAVISVVLTGQVDLAYADGIKDLNPDIYKPDLEEASKTGGPIVAVINFIIGFVGLIVLGWGIFSMVKDHGLKLITGKRSLKDPDLQAKLIGFIAGALLIFLAVTGAWFEVLKFAWEIFEKALSKITGA